MAITFTERRPGNASPGAGGLPSAAAGCTGGTGRGLAELVRQLDMARISTIHSFWTTLLRAHAVEARVGSTIHRAFAGPGRHLAGWKRSRKNCIAGWSIGCRRTGTGRHSVSSGFGRTWCGKCAGCRQEIDWNTGLHYAREFESAEWEPGSGRRFLPRWFVQIGQSEPARKLLADHRRGKPPRIR